MYALVGVRVENCKLVCSPPCRKRRGDDEHATFFSVVNHVCAQINAYSLGLGCSTDRGEGSATDL